MSGKRNMVRKKLEELVNYQIQYLMRWLDIRGVTKVNKGTREKYRGKVIQKYEYLKRVIKGVEEYVIGEKPAAYLGDQPYLFVSYSHDDKEVVYHMITRLQINGARIWYDEGLNPGDDVKGVIMAHLSKCQKFLVFLTPNSVRSEFVRKEIERAKKEGKEFIPLRYKIEVSEIPEELEIVPRLFCELYEDTEAFREGIMKQLPDMTDIEEADENS